MTDVVYYLFNSLGISSQPGRLMLLKWVKVREEVFNKILNTVTEAKNKGFKANANGREITLDNAESLLKGLGSGLIDCQEFFKKSTTILLMMYEAY